MRLNTLIAHAARNTTLSAIALCAAVALASTLHAQNFATHPCTDSNGGGDQGFFARIFNGEQACEVRATTFPLVNGHVSVNSMNGSIEVIGEDRQDITLEARVSAHAGSQSEAASILHEVTIATGGTIEAHGPKSYGNRNWGVSYKLRVPHRLAAELHTTNGGLTLSGLNGHIHGETVNGGVHFDRLSGDVRLITTNGGINATLDGPSWQGTGLHAETTNGGVTVSVPSSYSAHLVASTTNGGVSLNHAAADHSGVHRHSIDTNLGSGGATISFETTNGGITIN